MTQWLYIMFLYSNSTRKPFRSSDFAFDVLRCLTLSLGTYFHTHQMVNLQSVSTQQSPIPGFETGLKNDLASHQWVTKLETSTGNPLTSYDEIQCSDRSFSVVAWMFTHQQSNNVITGLNLQSKNKIPDFQCSFFAHSQRLNGPDFLNVGSQLCFVV